ncbi:hypothetical protein [Mycoplasmopsis alligatoris]|uniref:Uncharacterized protein n=1 Tax=Mycoplasmopsis alligatoris A21JP2 TaxID=747682 RepID=D4XVN7_9BACT|nr:hypothetical protein [Mycoplasmopsis alligatoris]EFF41719.1 hypothetical protein MALL_0537 [Mycoplasmopsis alligatoris A21JP2]
MKKIRNKVLIGAAIATPIVTLGTISGVYGNELGATNLTLKNHAASSTGAKAYAAYGGELKSKLNDEKYQFERDSWTVDWRFTSANYEAGNMYVDISFPFDTNLRAYEIYHKYKTTTDFKVQFLNVNDQVLFEKRHRNPNGVGNKTTYIHNNMVQGVRKLKIIFLDWKNTNLGVVEIRAFDATLDTLLYDKVKNMDLNNRDWYDNDKYIKYGNRLREIKKELESSIQSEMNVYEWTYENRRALRTSMPRSEYEKRKDEIEKLISGLSSNKQTALDYANQKMAQADKNTNLKYPEALEDYKNKIQAIIDEINKKPVYVFSEGKNFRDRLDKITFLDENPKKREIVETLSRMFNERFNKRIEEEEKKYKDEVKKVLDKAKSIDGKSFNPQYGNFKNEIKRLQGIRDSRNLLSYKEFLQETIEEKIKSPLSDYSPSSVELYKSKLKELAFKVDTTFVLDTPEYIKYSATLTELNSVLIPNYNNLIGVLNKEKDSKKPGYSSASVKKFKDELEKLIGELKDKKTLSIEEMDKYFVRLNELKSKTLVKNADVLKAELTLVSSPKLAKDVYTEPSWERFSKTLDEYQSLTSGDVLESTLGKKLEEIRKIPSILETNKNDLLKTVENIEKELNTKNPSDKSKFTESLNVFKSKINTLDESKVKKAEYDTYLGELDNLQLSFFVFKDVLNKLYDSKFGENQKQFLNAEGLEKYKKEISDLKTEISNTTTNKFVDYKKLEGKIDNLLFSVGTNKEVLEESLTDAITKLNLDLYTEESIVAFNTELENIRTEFKDAQVNVAKLKEGQAKIAEATKKLITYKTNLKTALEEAKNKQLSDKISPEKAEQYKAGINQLFEKVNAVPDDLLRFTEYATFLSELNSLSSLVDQITFKKLLTFAREKNTKLFTEESWVLYSKKLDEIEKEYNAKTAVTPVEEQRFISRLGEIEKVLQTYGSKLVLDITKLRLINASLYSPDSIDNFFDSLGLLELQYSTRDLTLADYEKGMKEANSKVSLLRTFPQALADRIKESKDRHPSESFNKDLYDKYESALSEVQKGQEKVNETNYHEYLDSIAKAEKLLEKTGWVIPTLIVLDTLLIFGIIGLLIKKFVSKKK